MNNFFLLFNSGIQKQTLETTSRYAVEMPRKYSTITIAFMNYDYSWNYRKSVAAETHLGTNYTVFKLFVLFIRAVWFSGVALLCNQIAKHKYNTNLEIISL